MAEELSEGALVTIDTNRTRVRVLPLDIGRWAQLRLADTATQPSATS
jgi:hypothetical protein